MDLKSYLLIGALLIIGCSKHTNNNALDKSLLAAGNNKKELMEVLNYYSHTNADSLKYKAACFLIENMIYHNYSNRAKYVDPQRYKIWDCLDSLYYKRTLYYTGEQIRIPKIRNYISSYFYSLSDLLGFCQLDSTIIETGVFRDIKDIKAEFLIEHINNAFTVWHSSAFARNLTFDEFCEYILPYSSVNGASNFVSGNFLNKRFGKYLLKTQYGDFQHFIHQYQAYQNSLWPCFSHLPCKKSIGVMDIFSLFDCVSTSSNACNIFRACGLPTVVDYTIRFKEYQGRHFHCVSLDTLGKWHRYDPLVPQLDTINPIRKESLNFYRNTYAAQKYTPYFLKSPNEYIPNEFNTPCIKDVTNTVYETTILKLPFTEQTNNNVAYLAVFDAENKHGILPVTWGEINKTNSEAIFQHVLYNTLYFPIYYSKSEPRYFGYPFYVIKDSIKNSFRVVYLPIDTISNVTSDFIITRKFPLKDNLTTILDKMIGGQFEGSNKEDFSTKSILYIIQERPQPYLQEFIINNNKKYKYYRYVAPKEYPYSNIVYLEFLAKKDSTYKYYEAPTQLPIFSEIDTLHSKETEFVQLVEKDTSHMRSRSPFTKKNWINFSNIINLNLEEEVLVERIRLEPRNASNIVYPGNKYELMYWNHGWHSCGIQKAKYSYVKFQNVPNNKVYWLKNLDHGNEEQPFILKDGKQLFIYKDIITN